MWKSWIPTNRGLLQKSFILGNSLFDEVKPNIYHTVCDESYSLNFSDTILKDNLKEQIFLQSEFTIDFNLLPWKFNILFYESDNRLGKIELIEVKGHIEQNGTVEFDFQVNKIFAGNLDNLSNTIFTYLKRKIHTDIHHDEKVDDVLPVVLSDKFSYDDIADSLLNEIKKMEVEAKRLYLSKSNRRKQYIVNNIYPNILGFNAYLHSFEELFKDKLDSPATRQNSKYIIDSLKTLKIKVESEISIRKHKVTLRLALIAIFVSLNIFAQNHYIEEITKSYPFLVIGIIGFLIIIVHELVMIYVYGDGIVRSLVRLNPHAKEYYSRLYIATSTDTKVLKKNKLSFKQRIMADFLKFGNWVLVPLLVVLVALLVGSIEIDKLEIKMDENKTDSIVIPRKH